MTEVHHISGHGEDSGVVYSEMQVRGGGITNAVSKMVIDVFKLVEKVKHIGQLLLETPRQGLYRRKM